MNTRRPTPCITFAASVALALPLALPGLAHALGASYATPRAQLTAAPRGEAKNAPPTRPTCDCGPRSAHQTAQQRRSAAIAPPRNSLARALWSRESDRRLRRRAPDPGRRSTPAGWSGRQAWRSSPEVRITQVGRTAAVFHEAHAPPASSFAVD